MFRRQFIKHTSLATASLTIFNMALFGKNALIQVPKTSNFSPARDILVNINNLTPFSLTKVGEGLDHGAWTWDVPPLQNVPPNFINKFFFEAESAGVATGTEGYVRYKIEDGKNSEFYFHWDNAYASNVVGPHYNFFIEQIPDGYAIWHTGNDNDQNENVQLYIDSSKDVVISNFLPSTSAFKFRNHWNDFGYPIPALHDVPLIGDMKLGDASNGLCGGMVYAVRDYYEAKVPIPQTSVPANDPNDPLTKYIIDRLLASLDLNDVTMYIKLMNPIESDTDENLLNELGQEGRAYITLREEWPMIKNDIDNGHPSPIGLIRVKSTLPSDVGQNHQVLVYGYRMSGSHVLLRIYDPNYPLRDDITINLSLASTSDPVNAIYSINDGKPIYAIFRTNYESRDFFPRNYQTDVFSINKNGELSVFGVVNGGKWSDPIGISPRIFPAGGKLAASKQFGVDNQTNVFSINNNGELTVSWVNAHGRWSTPFSISSPNTFPAGGAVAASNQFGVYNQTDVFAINNNGELTVSWVLSGGRWSGPVPISHPNTFKPGGYITASNQFGVDNQTCIFAINNSGQLTISWAIGNKPWNSPVSISPPDTFSVSAPIIASKQFGIDNQTNVFVVNKNGQLTVSWIIGSGHWNGPLAVSKPNTFPIEAVIAASNQIGVPNQTDVFAINNNGELTVSWVIGGGRWNEPVSLSNPNTFPAGGAVFASQQFGSFNQTDVFAINNNGELLVYWAVGSGKWSEPFAISHPNTFSIGAAITSSEQFGAI